MPSFRRLAETSEDLPLSKGESRGLVPFSQTTWSSEKVKLDNAAWSIIFNEDFAHRILKQLI
jgi:hypothetical protein